MAARSATVEEFSASQSRRRVIFNRTIQSRTVVGELVIAREALWPSEAISWYAPEIATPTFGRLAMTEPPSARDGLPTNVRAS
jgi:hypothetical protein